MKREASLLVLLLACAAFVVLPSGVAAGSLSKPSVSLPSGWQLKDETAYPSAYGEHDPQGSGFVEYYDPATYDFVMIYYENNNGASYTNAALQAEAETIYQRDIGALYTDSGVTTFAGVPAGYVRVYNSTLDTYELELIFVKGNYYFDVFSYYSASSQSKVNSLINSISPSDGGILGTYLVYIIIAVVVVVVLVIVAIMVRRRGKSSKPPLTSPTYPPPTYPPPP